MEQEINALIVALNSESPQARKAAQIRLVEIGPAVVEPLIAVMQGEVSRPAWNAAQVLGDVGDARAFPALIAAVLSPNALLGSAAAKAALKISLQDALPPLLQALRQAPLMTQQSIVLALQQSTDRRTVAALIDLLKTTPSPVMRTAVIKVLGELGDPSAAPVVRAYLNDEDHHVRDWAARVVQKLEEHGK